MKNKGSSEVAAIFGLLFVGAIFVSLSLWTDRTLDFWLTYFKGQSIDCPFWLSLIVTFVLNGIIVALNVVSEIVRLVL